MFECHHLLRRLHETPASSHPSWGSSSGVKIGRDRRQACVRTNLGGRSSNVPPWEHKSSKAKLPKRDEANLHTVVVLKLELGCSMRPILPLTTIALAEAYAAIDNATAGRRVRCHGSTQEDAARAFLAPAPLLGILTIRAWEGGRSKPSGKASLNRTCGDATPSIPVPCHTARVRGVGIGGRASACTPCHLIQALCLRGRATRHSGCRGFQPAWGSRGR